MIKMDVSVIIVNWNTKELLRSCIESIYKETCNCTFEIIVVDNNSSDDSVEMIQAEFPQVKLIANETNMGFAGGNNKGINIAKGRYILVLNSDIIICDQAIEKTVKYADRKPRAGMISCHVVNLNGRIAMTTFSFPCLWNLFCRFSGLASTFRNSRIFGRDIYLWWDRKSERNVDSVSGSFILVRREAIDQVGLMDEDYFLYYEETDWCYRFGKAGWEIIFWPGAKIIHIGDQSSKQEELKMFVQFHKSLLIFFKKHHSLTSYFTARTMVTINSGLRAMFAMAMAGLKKVFGGSTGSKQVLAKKYWWVFKYCILGIEPPHKSHQYSAKNTISISFKLKRMLIDGMEFFLAASYAIALILMRRKKQRVIIYYHGVKKNEIHGFEKQISYLANHCRVVGLTELMRMSGDGSEKSLAITFDDGFKSVAENGWSILKKYKLKGAMFTPVGNLGQPPRWNIEAPWAYDCDEFVINEQTVSELDSQGFEIHSHTVSHADLTDTEPEQLKTELTESRQRLEQIVGHKVSTISYPLGRYNKNVIGQAKQAGYRYGFTVDPYTVDDSPSEMEIGRFVVDPNMNMLKFRLKVSGAYQVTSHLRKLKTRFFHK